MSHYVPDWTEEDDSRFFGDLLPVTNQKLSTGAEDELIELLWQNGHVVMHSQTQRRNPVFDEFKQVQKTEQVQRLEQSVGNSSTLIQDDDDASWFQYPVDDSLDKVFCSEFFEMGGTDAYGSNKISKDTIAGQERFIKFGACNDGTLGMPSAPDHCTVSEKIPLPNPRSNILNSPPEASCLENDGVLNFSHFTRSTKGNLESSSSQFCNEGSAGGIKVRAQEPSMMTVGSSNCGSNQVQSHVECSYAFSNDTAGGPAGPSGEDGRICLPTDTEIINAHETTTTSSSGGSGFSIGRSVQQSQSNQSQKRKGRDAEDLECQSEDAGHGKRITKKPTQRSISTRRSRAAEVHNLSERRRRDRINEKMKALQELIPHCNKADKASMLDEAIEYLKTLQLQVQMMWMGGSMAAPMMFPGMQQYMSAIGMGMAPASLPSMANAVQMARIPYVNQTVATAPARNQTPIYPSPSIPAVNFSNPVQGIHHPDPYAYLGFSHFQPQVQKNQPAVPTCGSSLTNAGGRASSKGENRSG